MIVRVPGQLHAATALLKLAQLPDPPQDSPQTLPEEEPVRRPALHALKATVGPALAFGAGTAAGYGAQLGAEKLLGRQLTPGRLRMVAPVLGGALGLAYNQYKDHERQELHRAFEAYKNKSQGVVPSE